MISKLGKLFTVYEHISPSGKVYVGITSIPVKWRWGRNGSGYTTREDQKVMKSAILKYGWDNFEHKIVLEKVSESEAKYAEKYLIKWYKLHRKSYNMTDGGEGTCGIHHYGRIPSEETRKKLSEAHKGLLSGEKNPMYGRHETSPAFGKFGKKHPASKPVYQYSSSGEFLKEWGCAVEAALALSGNYNLSSNISAVCRGIIPSAFGYIWKFFKVDRLPYSIKLRNIKRQFNKKLELDREKLSFEREKHQDDVDIKNRQIAVQRANKVQSNKTK